MQDTDRPSKKEQQADELIGKLLVFDLHYDEDEYVSSEYRTILWSNKNYNGWGLVPDEKTDDYYTMECNAYLFFNRDGTVKCWVKEDGRYVIYLLDYQLEGDVLTIDEDRYKITYAEMTDSGHMRIEVEGSCFYDFSGYYELDDNETGTQLFKRW